MKQELVIVEILVLITLSCYEHCDLNTFIYSQFK